MKPSPDLSKLSQTTKSWGNAYQLPIVPILTEEINVCCVGHVFGKLPVLPGQSGGHFVQDFLVDQSQSTGGGARMVDPVQFDLTQSPGYVFRIQASCGKRF